MFIYVLKYIIIAQLICRKIESMQYRNSKSCHIEINFDIATPHFDVTEIKGHETMSQTYEFGIAMIRENKPFDYNLLAGKKQQ